MSEKSQTQILAENLKRMMREYDYSQHQLARKIGATPAIVNRWCNGAVMPRNDKIDALCKIFDCNRSDLLTEQTSIPNLSVPAAYPLPILGTICAGNGILAEQNFDGYFFVDNSIRADYCLRVEGDSMRDAGIQHGDTAFIRKSYNFVEGGIYAVVFGENNNAVLKKVYSQGDGYLLEPCNLRYQPIYVDEALIVGECIGVYHPR
jgi:repressor LexA